jgi:hypothetical protein
MADDQEVKITSANNPFASSTQPCTVEHVPRHLKMHSVSESELDAVASGNSSINLTFFGVCLGAAISFGIVLRTANLEVFNKSLFGMLFFTSLIMGAYFGIRGGADYLRSKAKLQEIKGKKNSN